MKIMDSALERFGLPDEALSGSRIIISGGKLISIENHRGLLEYSADAVLVALRKGRLAVRGKDLRIGAMERGALVIKGKVQGLDLEQVL